MPDFYQDIADFHEKFGLVYEGKPRTLPHDLHGFRLRFMDEELSEYNQAATQARVDRNMNDEWGYTTRLELQLDALVDLVYVALGTAYLHGFDFDEAWRRVHEANMKKIRAERPEDSKRGSTYDVIKPPGWQSPTHADLVKDNDFD